MGSYQQYLPASASGGGGGGLPSNTFLFNFRSVLKNRNYVNFIDRLNNDVNFSDAGFIGNINQHISKNENSKMEVISSPNNTETTTILGNGVITNILVAAVTARTSLKVTISANGQRYTFTTQADNGENLIMGGYTQVVNLSQVNANDIESPLFSGNQNILLLSPEYCSRKGIGIPFTGAATITIEGDNFATSSSSDYGKHIILYQKNDAAVSIEEL